MLGDIKKLDEGVKLLIMYSCVDHMRSGCAGTLYFLIFRNGIARVNLKALLQVLGKLKTFESTKGSYFVTKYIELTLVPLNKPKNTGVSSLKHDTKLSCASA